MTASHFSRMSPDEPMTVVVDPGEPPYDAPPFLELRGPLDTRRLEAALDRIAARRPDGPAWQHRLRPHGPGLHTLRFTTGAPGEFPAGLLADLLTDPPPAGRSVRAVAPSPLQHELLTDADAHPGTGRHVEQLSWVWHGPLDPERFTAAWQSLIDRESVLRSAFADGPEPRIVVHDRVRAEVVRLSHSAEDWAAVVEYDRRRGLDPRRPGPLRVTVLGGGPVASVTAPPTRVLLTYHHALLDDWSARLLLREFYRAYLADGTLPGGERRPDMGDYAQWLARQDIGPARAFWTDATPPPAVTHSLLPVAAAPATAPASAAVPGRTGTGRTRLRLTAAQTARLGAWAAGWGSTESGALQAAWALLLYRAAGTADAEPVRFSVTVSGRGILFEGAERLPGALRNPLPMSVVVDPRASVPELLALLRDRALDMAAYEWVSAGQIRTWTEDRADAPGAAGSLVAFEGGPGGPDGLTRELAAQGIRVDPPETLGARTAFPLTLVARHDGDGRLVVTVSYDRTRLAGIGTVLTHAAFLLAELPRVAGESTTIAEVLELLADADIDADADTDTDTEAEAAPTTPVDDPADADDAPALITLRPARNPGAGTVCLVPSHGTPRFCYDLLARSYRGPEALVLLGSPPDDDRAGYDALRPLIDAGGYLVLGGFSGCGAAAYGITRLIAANGGRPPLIVLTAAATPADDLARLLESAAERAG
ncbi:condensation domain-containing protein [Streptomyces sp. NPDC056237]|uniref:condensation domain-containing protein n=2 Tax=Streptomyces TaxID=1883 RepID=UPI0035DB5504